MGRLPDRVESPRLVLRAWTPDDAAALNAAIAASLDHLRPWMPWAAFEPASLAARLDLIEQWRSEREQGGDSVLGIFASGEVVGGCGLHRRSGPDTLEVGYWVHVDELRRGYAAEAAAALTSAAFADAAIEYVELHHDRANVASAGVPRRLGYTLVGETPKEVGAPGEVGVNCCWRISRSVWSSESPAASEGTEELR